MRPASRILAANLSASGPDGGEDQMRHRQFRQLEQIAVHWDADTKSIGDLIEAANIKFE